MRVFDRYQAMDVELPEVVEPGRYRVLRRTVLNRQTELVSGDLLWSDGGGLCELEGEGSRTFARVTDDVDGQSPEAVVDDAVQAVVDQLESVRSELPSPVMPAQLGDLAFPTRLELELEGVLGRGHLQAIAARPRMAMRYESELLPVSRAKRLAHDAITRLASHSEDWLRREITGVVPRNLKAEVSDDDVAIYENVVFARLLDRLEKGLRRRIREVEVLLRKHEQAMALANAERLDYRLRNALCSLWGLSFADNPATGKAASTTLHLLQTLLGKVRQLKRSDLYAGIPTAHRVPLALRSTNVLLHDTHYRCLRPLWVLAHAGEQTQAPAAPERFAVAKLRGERFGKYVGLLIRHALFACKLVLPSSVPSQYLFGKRSLTLTWSSDQWVLRLQDEAEPLQFVPAWRGATDWSISGNRRIVFCHGTAAAPAPAPAVSVSLEPGIEGILNPLEFYGVERIRQAIEVWLMGTLLRRYPIQVLSLPSALRDRIALALGDSVSVKGRGLLVQRSVSDSALQQVERATTELHANASTRQELSQALNDVKLVSTCRACGAGIPSTSFHSSSEGFKAACECGQRWTLRLHQGMPVQATFQLGDVRRPFNEVGSLQLELAWS